MNILPSLCQLYFRHTYSWLFCERLASCYSQSDYFFHLVLNISKDYRPWYQQSPSLIFNSRYWFTLRYRLLFMLICYNQSLCYVLYDFQTLYRSPFKNINKGLLKEKKTSVAQSYVIRLAANSIMAEMQSVKTTSPICLTITHK